MPPGASTGTSASLAVALLAALAHLRGESPAPADLARSAHRLETGRLGLQSGIQDQIAASYGGINFVEMPSYPDALVNPLTIRQRRVPRSRIDLSSSTWGERIDPLTCTKT
jgi:D-glycero-alpha-D-manno-heptose-7-phosphate kinase